MKKWLILLWLLVPVALLTYHFGPGQAALAFRSAQMHTEQARQLEHELNWSDAIAAYDLALHKLPESTETAAASSLARDQLRLAQIRARFQLGRLAETIDNLNTLVEDVERDHGSESPLGYDVRDFLGRVHFQAMVALRLEQAEDAVWRRHWELSRQNFRFLAEHTRGQRNALDRQNLEAVIKSAELPPDAFAAPAGGAATTAGLATTKTPPPPNAAAGNGGPPTLDSRPRPPIPGVPPPPVPEEFDLGS